MRKSPWVIGEKSSATVVPGVASFEVISAIQEADQPRSALQYICAISGWVRASLASSIAAGMPKIAATSFAPAARAAWRSCAIVWLSCSTFIPSPTKIGVLTDAAVPCCAMNAARIASRTAGWSAPGWLKASFPSPPA